MRPELDQDEGGGDGGRLLEDLVVKGDIGQALDGNARSFATRLPTEITPLGRLAPERSVSACDWSSARAAASTAGGSVVRSGGVCRLDRRIVAHIDDGTAA